MKQLDLDEVLKGGVSAGSPVEQDAAGTSGSGAAPQHDVRSPVADAAVRSGAAQFCEIQKRAEKIRGGGEASGSALQEGHSHRDKGGGRAPSEPIDQHRA